MKIAVIASNQLSINKKTKKGTEIFVHTLVNSLIKHHEVELTVFASGDSSLPTRIESIGSHSSDKDQGIISSGKHIIFELALISKAFTMQDKFDLYHVNIGDGDIVLPFAPFVKKPILITLHHTQVAEYINKYFSLFARLKNVSFISVSNAQRDFFPNLNYVTTIYHGIETEQFKFNPKGGESIIWAGRGIPDKGLGTILEVLKKTKKKIKLFPMKKDGYIDWLNKQIINLKDLVPSQNILIEFDKNRYDLIAHYQSSKLFLFPLQWEEPFGLVLIESMACGTPAVAFARGSIPEIIKDGETGFIVNSSEADIRGDWLVKKTGIEGLCEAIEKIYSMKDEEYQKMRLNCRALIEKSFSSKHMADEYLKVYKKIMAE